MIVGSIFLLSLFLNLLFSSNAWESEHAIVLEESDSYRELRNVFSRLKWQKKLKACRAKVGNDPLPLDQWEAEVEQLDDGVVKDKLQELLGLSKDLNLASITRNMIEMTSQPIVTKRLATIKKLQKKVKSISPSDGTDDTANAAALLDIANTTSIAVDEMAQAFKLLQPLQEAVSVIAIILYLYILLNVILVTQAVPIPAVGKFVYVLLFVITSPFWILWLWLHLTCKALPFLCNCKIGAYNCGPQPVPNTTATASLSAAGDEALLSLMDNYMQCEFEKLIGETVPAILSISKEISGLGITTGIAP